MLKNDGGNMLLDKNQSKMSVEDAGRKGGQTTARKLGSEFYAEIGRKGGQAVSRNKSHMSRIGRKGGMAKGKTTSG